MKPQPVIITSSLTSTKLPLKRPPALTSMAVAQVWLGDGGIGGPNSTSRPMVPVELAATTMK
ncbi:MAG TPA: hypothetical protein DEF51_43350 [Myxococcales bacterium]|nr:hypothetical protein [Myxococcales bacterium]